MYRNLFVAGLILFLSLLNPAKIQAHPIDNTDTYFYFEKEIDGFPLDKSEIKMYSYINWTQAALLVNKELGITPPDILELLNYQNVYDSYVQNNIKISNNNEQCTLNVDKSPVTEDQISLSLGTRVIGTFICPTEIENIRIENNLFLNDFEFESNFTSIYIADTLLHAFTMDKSIQSYEFNLEDLRQNPKSDETYDNSADLSAEQVTRKVNEPKQRSFLSTVTDGMFLKTNTIKDQSVPFLLLLVFLLGFLHTVEAGHSKTILASSMISNKMDFRRGIAYAIIFTITHLADIIIVGLILLIADNYFNVLSSFSMLEKFAGYALFFMSIYLLLKSVQGFLKKRMTGNKEAELHSNGRRHDHHHELDSSSTFKDQLALGFLSGLAPCVFGWSIFMLILSTNRLWILIPSIISFGLGIFTALAILVFLLTHLRNSTYSRFEKVAEISPFISALFLLVYSIFLVF